MANLETRNYSPFTGDAGATVEPIQPPVMTLALSVTNQTARDKVDEFVDTGMCEFGSMGSAVWIITAWCTEQGIPFNLEQLKTGDIPTGWRISRIYDDVNPAGNEDAPA